MKSPLKSMGYYNSHYNYYTFLTIAIQNKTVAYPRVEMMRLWPLPVKQPCDEYNKG
jgi:hypothetical protein